MTLVATFASVGRRDPFGRREFGLGAGAAGADTDAGGSRRIRVDLHRRQVSRPRTGGALSPPFYGLRQVICFTLGADRRRCLLAPATRRRRLRRVCSRQRLAGAGAQRAPIAPARRATSARRAQARTSTQFFVYAKPIVASLVIYQAIGTDQPPGRRSTISARLPTGGCRWRPISARGCSRRSTTLMEYLVLFQAALRDRPRTKGRAAAERQLGRQHLCLSLRACWPCWTAGYVAMVPTFEAIVVPAAYRSAYASLSVDLTPGTFPLIP